MSPATPLSSEIIITGFDGFQRAMDGMAEAFARDRPHVYVLADHPDDPHLADHTDQGWIRYSDFLYPSEMFSEPEGAHHELAERADPSLVGTLFTPLENVDPDAEKADGRVYHPVEFSEFVTDLSSEHRESIIISGRFHPPGDYQVMIPSRSGGPDSPGWPDAYTLGNLTIPARVLPGGEIGNLMACNPTLFGSMIIPRDMISEGALEIADRGLDVSVETDGGDQ